MKFNNIEDDDDEKRRDYFDGPDVEEPKVPKPPRHRPDEPEYYDGDGSRWEHLVPERRTRFWIYLLLAAVVVALIWAFYVRYFSPVVVDATQFGYIESVENRGKILKTGEGVLIPYKELMDTTRVYQRDFVFSVRSPRVLEFLKEMQIEGKPVRVQYERYNAVVPWRGESKIIVVAADSADPAKILPPEFNPAYFRDRRDRSDTAQINARQRLIDRAEAQEE